MGYKQYKEGLSLTDISRLKWANYILTGVHLIAALALAIFAWIYNGTEFKVNLLRGTKEYTISGIYIVYLAIAFLFITSIFHLYYSRSVSYLNNIKSGYQPIRWIEYGITATIMGFIVAVVSGVRDIYLLAALTIIVFAVMTTGYFFEIFFNFYSNSLIPIAIGFVLLIVYSIIVFLVYRDEASKVEDLPKWITWAVIGTLIAFGIFGIIPIIQYFGLPFINKWRFIWSEYGYIFLSATAKLFLGGLLGYGILRRPAE